MDKLNSLQGIKNSWVKAIVKFLLLIVIFFTFIILIFQLPVFQTIITKRSTDYLNEKLQEKVYIENIQITWFDRIVIRNLRVEDAKGNTLISLKKAKVKYDIFNLITRDAIILKDVELVQPSVNLAWYKDIENINMHHLFLNIGKLFASSDTTQDNSKAKKFLVKKCHIEDGAFTYFDHLRPQSTDTTWFDYLHFGYKDVYADVSNMGIYTDTIYMEVKNLSCLDPWGDFKVSRLDVNFSICPRFMEYTDIDGIVGKNTCINQYVRFDYNSYSSMAYFEDSVYMKARFNGAEIHYQDVAYFIPPLRQYKDDWIISGYYEGYLNDFKSKNAKLGFGYNSFVKGKIHIKNILNIDSTQYDLNLKKVILSGSDLAPYLSGSLANYAPHITSLAGDFKFKGTIHTFDLATKFNSNLGDGDLSYTYKDIPVQNTFDYVLDFKTDSFDVRPFSPTADLTYVSGVLNLSDTHKSNSLKSILIYDLDFNSMTFKNYTYHDFKSKGKFENNQFKGSVFSLDTNFHADLVFDVGFYDKQDVFRINGEIDHWDFYKTNLYSQPLTISAQLDIDAKGNQLDNYMGFGSIENLKISNGEHSAFSELIEVKLITDSVYKDVAIHSDLFDLSLQGKYTYKDLVFNVKSVIEEQYLIISNDSVGLANYYEDLVQNPLEPLVIDINLNVKKLNPFLNVLAKDFYVSDNSTISAFYREGGNAKFYIDGKFDQIGYGEFRFKNAKIDVLHEAIGDSVHNLKLNYSADQFKKANSPLLSNIIFNSEMHEKHLDYHILFDQYGQNNQFDFEGIADFKPKGVELKIEKSNTKILGNSWKVTPDNKITINKHGVNFNELDFFHDQQHILFDGLISDTEQDNVQLFVHRFDLKNIAPFIETDIKGELNGNIFINDVNEKLLVNSFIKIDSLRFNDRYVGDIQGKFLWDSDIRVLNTDVNLKIQDNNVMNLTGTIEQNDTSNVLNLKANFNKTKLSLLGSVLDEYISDIKGDVNGELKIKGTLDHPKFYGHLYAENSGFRLNYFNTYYSFHEKVIFRGDSIYTPHFELTDTLWGTKAHVKALITHRFFQDYLFDVKLNLDKTFVLNTERKHNNSYYGTAFATGEIDVKGKLNDLFISSNEVLTNKGTKLSIPLDYSDSYSLGEDYIRFKKKETVVKTKKTDESNEGGMNISLNFNINNDADFEIIFDEKAGDIIRCTGGGNILMQLDTRGDFNIYGEYAIQKGTYNFTLVNLINKSFKINNNSTITWNGSPYDGKLKVEALYTIRTSLVPIINADTSFFREHPEVKRRVPVDVIMKLNGPLTNPDLKFKINIREYPNYAEVEHAIIDLNSRMQYNEQLLNQEVFSLLVLRQLSNPDQFNASVSGGSANSVSELLSNQFSNWISQFDENLQVNIDVSGFNKDQASSFSLSMSYSMLDGKIRISNEGSFQNVQSQKNIANVFGDWTLEYLITNDGKLRVKAYNKVYQNSISTSLTSSNSTVYGASLMYTTSFDNLAELFRKNKNQKEMEVPEDEVEATKEDEIKIEDEHNETTK